MAQITSFASADDYILRYGPVADVQMLEQRLCDSTVFIMQELRRWGIAYDEPDDLQAAVLSMVCCSVTERIMPKAGGDIPAGLTSYSQSSNGFQETLGFSAAYGSPKLLPHERRALGIECGAIWGIAPMMPEDRGDDACIA